jgi:hypothetical protein
MGPEIAPALYGVPLRALHNGYVVKYHREGSGVEQYRWHVELVLHGGPAGARVLQRTGEHPGPEGALRALLKDLEEEVDEKMKFNETERFEIYADSVDLDQIP